MFAPTYCNVISEYKGNCLKINFVFRDEEDYPYKFWLVAEKDSLVSNCDSSELLEAVYEDVTGNKVILHSKYFHIFGKYYYRIYAL